MTAKRSQNQETLALGGSKAAGLGVLGAGKTHLRFGFAVGALAGAVVDHAVFIALDGGEVGAGERIHRGVAIHRAAIVAAGRQCGRGGSGGDGNGGGRKEFMQTELSRKARRALDALLALAGEDGITNASWAQIAQAAGVGRTNIAEAMRELAYAGEIIAVDKEAGMSRRYKIIGRGTQETAEGKRGHKLQACSDSMTMNGESDNPSTPVHTSPHQSAPVRTGSSLDELSTDDEFDDDDARKKTFFAVTALLGEYGLTQPWRDILVKDIAPAIQRGIMTLDDARTICAKTQKEAESWKQPRKIMFVRLRTRARGELQDPLPLILEMPAEGAAAQGEKTAKTYQRKQSKRGVSRRTQIQYTDEMREAAKERARQQIAERAARRGSSND